MAAIESRKFVPFTFPPSNPPFCSSNALRPAETGCSNRSPNTSSQKVRKPAAAFPRPRRHDTAGWNTTARAEGHQRALANNDEESDDDPFPSLKELSQTPLPPNISSEAAKTKCTFPHLKQPARDGTGLQVNQIQSGLGGRQGDSQDQPMILDDDESDEADEAEDTSGDADAGRIERDASPHNALTTAGLALDLAKATDAPSLEKWFDLEKGCYVYEPVSGPGSCEQQGAPSAPAQDQPHTLRQSSGSSQDQINQQDTQSTSVESAPHSRPRPSDNSDDGWTEDGMAELEKEVELALVEQAMSSSASAPNSPRLPCSVKAPQNEIQSQERTETTGGRPEELQDACRHGAPAQGLEEWEQRESEVVVVEEAGGVAMLLQQGLAAQRAELGQPAVSEGDQQDLVEVVNTEDPEDKEATEALPTTQPEIDEHRFRLRGIRTQPIAGRQTGITQYRVVWGKHPNRSDSWVDEDDLRMSVLRPPRERSSQNLVPPVERDVTRVHRMRSDRCSKGKKIFEYLVNKSRTWITEDQLRISLNPMLVAELKASSPHPLSEAQREVLLRHSATLISDEYRHPADPVLGGKLATLKRGHQDMHTEISSDTHHSVNTDDHHNACDTSDEDPRPAKRRKPRSARAVTPPLHLQRSPPAPPTTRAKIDESQSQDDHGCSSTFTDEQHRASRTSRSPSAAAAAVPVTEYREWPFQGFLKRTRIGDDVTYNLEFKLPSISEHLHLPIHPEALDLCPSKEGRAKVLITHDAAAHSKTRHVKSRHLTKRILWTKEEDETLVKMKEEDGCSWEEISDALPSRTPGAIQVRYFTKFRSSGATSRKHRRP